MRASVLFGFIVSISIAACSKASPPPVGPAAADKTTATACSIVGTWASQAGKTEEAPLFTRFEIRQWTDRFVVDHDGRVNAVTSTQLVDGAFTVQLKVPADLSSKTQEGSPASSRGAPASMPDMTGPHAKPPTTLSSGVLSTSDPASYRCQPAADCASLACTFTNGAGQPTGEFQMRR